MRCRLTIWHQVAAAQRGCSGHHHHHHRPPRQAPWTSALAVATVLLLEVAAVGVEVVVVAVEVAVEVAVAVAVVVGRCTTRHTTTRCYTTT